MIPRSRRIKTSLFRSSVGKTFRGTLIQMRARKADDSLPARFAVIVSKKTAKTAVMRNSIRRTVYAALDPFLAQVIPGFLCFFYPTRDVQSASRAILEDELERLFQEAKLLSK